MNTIRLNITVPIDVGRHLRGIKNVSAFISQTLREKFRRLDEDKKSQELEEAYRASSAEEKDLQRDWDTTSGDGL